MEPIRFTERDGEILYTIPRPPVGIADIVSYYTFINRAAPPSYDEMVGCLSRSFNAGVTKWVDGEIAVVDSWYQIIHAADETTENEIDSMIEFVDWLTVREFPAVYDSGFSLDRNEYQAIQEHYSAPVWPGIND